ncbi:hypothetical protein [Trueperella bialowiezensis]|uniref:Uncharacterized protein n=1 Tax=Trueperella bialowiezensis TaxID=312285 RepID=A0A448PEC1_9ACTO|nr:hypothetical protein [Trueperella bialowiezensis]VEI13240.1 Uncharacterised protein [Trueperella bialowiezensis]
MTTTEELMNTYQALKVQRETITEQMEQTKTLLAAALPDGGEVAGHKVVYTRGRVNWAKIARTYPQENNPHLYQTVTELNRKAVPENVQDEFRAEATVTIR